MLSLFALLALSLGPAQADNNRRVDLDAAAGPLPETLVIDQAYAQVHLPFRDGVPAAATQGSYERDGSLAVTLFQTPEGFGDAAYRCTIEWTGLAATATQADVSAWPHLWVGYRLPAGTPDSTGESCALLDPDRWGDDPAATVADAGWHVGFGPVPDALYSMCPVPQADHYVAVYLWLDGAAPLVAGLAEAKALDAEGATTGTWVTGASSADTMPADVFPWHLCPINFGI